MPYNYKMPDVPAELLIKTLDAQPYTVSGGFINILVWWLGRGKLESPNAQKIRLMSLLADHSWSNYGSQLESLCNEFYPAFLTYISRRKKFKALIAANTIKAQDVSRELRNSNRSRKKLSDEVANVPQIPHTYIPVGHTKSPNYDAKSRAEALKAKKKPSEGVTFND